MEKLNVAIADDNEKMLDLLGKKYTILSRRKSRTLSFWIL